MSKVLVLNKNGQWSEPVGCIFKEFFLMSLIHEAHINDEEGDYSGLTINGVTQYNDNFGYWDAGTTIEKWDTPDLEAPVPEGYVPLKDIRKVTVPKKVILSLAKRFAPTGPSHFTIVLDELVEAVKKPVVPSTTMIEGYEEVWEEEDTVGLRFE